MSTDIRQLLDIAALSPSHSLDPAPLLRTASRRIARRRALLVAVPVVAIAVLIGAAGSSSLLSGPGTPRITTHTRANPPTKGPMPTTIPTLPDGSTDYSRVPDFIPALAPGTDTIAGYVRTKDLLDPTFGARQTVYGDDLETVVGHMYSGRGFVPIGKDPTSVPTFPSSTVANPVGPGSDHMTTTSAAP